MSTAHAVVSRGSVPIEVQVEVTEIDHRKASQLGVEWPTQIDVTEIVPGSLGQVGSFQRVTPLQAKLHLLIQDGAAELLANPNLITDSGTTATFQAGGQIPYITSSSLGSTNVEFKPYGVLLQVSPTMLPSGRIELKVRASVSAPDSSGGVLLSGNEVPAIQERVVTSHITVEPGNTITLAGLVQTLKEDITQGVPVLRRIPILGALFRWKKTNYRRTSVVVFMTPRIKDF